MEEKRNGTEKKCHREKIWRVQVPYALAAYVSLSGWPFPYTIMASFDI